MDEPLHLFKGALIRQISWRYPLDRPIIMPYMKLKEDKKKSITLTIVDKEDAEKLLDKARAVLKDFRKANELLPLSFKYLVGGDKAYNEAYFKEVQQLADHLQDTIGNTAWDKGELLYFYQEPSKQHL